MHHLVNKVLSKYNVTSLRRSLWDNKGYFQFNLWLQKKGVIGNCGGDRVHCFEGKLTLKKDTSYEKDSYIWCCTKKECGYKISVRAGSWFENSNLFLQQVVKQTYYWVYKARQDTGKTWIKNQLYRNTGWLVQSLPWSLFGTLKKGEL